jgi:phospholipid/cholesterol/gamma-HCH transport system ATP-binding protein
MARGFGSNGAQSPVDAQFAGGKQLDPEGMSLLDRAADYGGEHDLHQGSVLMQEKVPGEFWAIETKGVKKSFGRAKILQGLDLGIPEGMVTVVLGPSGTGKSVLIKHIIGLLFPDQGEVFVHGESLSKMTMARLLEVRKKFGILFQDGALFGSMSVYDNVAFPLRQHTDLGEGEIAEIVNARLTDVGLTHAGGRLPNELSGGMRKRAGFARALVLEPEIVMFDEPDSGLDPVRTALLCELVTQMHEQHGGTYIIITHDIESARLAGEFFAVLWKGKIVQAGEREEMFNSENPFVQQFLNRRLDGPLGME